MMINPDDEMEFAKPSLFKQNFHKSFVNMIISHAAIDLDQYPLGNINIADCAMSVGEEKKVFDDRLSDILVNNIFRGPHWVTYVADAGLPSLTDVSFAKTFIQQLLMPTVIQELFDGKGRLKPYVKNGLLTCFHEEDHKAFERFLKEEGKALILYFCLFQILVPHIINNEAVLPEEKQDLRQVSARIIRALCHYDDTRNISPMLRRKAKHLSRKSSSVDLTPILEHFNVVEAGDKKEPGDDVRLEGNDPLIEESPKGLLHYFKGLTHKPSRKHRKHKEMSKECKEHGKRSASLKRKMSARNLKRTLSRGELKNS